MPDKYHIESKPVPPRRPRVGKYGVVDWREDCARCHNCVKKACIYDRHRLEMEYIRNLNDVDALFFDCMGCFSCVQDCTKNLLSMALNPAFERLGNRYWTPDIIRTTWLQAETGKIPVSGAGYGGLFSGPGFDSMWTDMSEIVRPTRDGIHGREYISTSVDIGRKPSFLTFDNNTLSKPLQQLVTLPLPVILDMNPSCYSLPELDMIRADVAKQTGLITVMDSSNLPLQENGFREMLPHTAMYLRPDDPLPKKEIMEKTRLVEIADDADAFKRVRDIKTLYPGIVVSVRVVLDSHGVERAIELANENIEAVHITAGLDGDEIGVEHRRFIKDMIRQIHTTLVESGKRDEVTIIAGGGIALPEHMAKAIICGADLVSLDLPLLLALECHLCDRCETGRPCPAMLDNIEHDYGVGRMTNLLAAWHGQLIEVMGAMGMREIRRLRGETGRALFFEELEEETFGRFFGQRKLS